VKRTASAAMPTLLAIILLVFAFNIQPVKTEPITIIVPDDYPTIQEAINAASDGDTVFVRNGTYYEQVVISKTVSLIGETKETTVIDGNMTAAVVWINADNVEIAQFTIRNGGGHYAGITLSSIGNHITNNILLNNWCGINLKNYVAYNVIAGNNIMNNLNGISGEMWSNNAIIGNTLTDNLLGIYIGSYSNHNTIAFNNIRNHWREGISMWHSAHNTFEGNDITDNNRGGFSAGITIGFQIGFSSGNNFFHNNMVNNGKQIDLQGEQEPIVWDNGCEGNYWSDYNGADLDGDGIGDTPYIIDENNADGYPLMNPYWNPADVDHDLDVDIYDVVLACNAYGSTYLDPHWNPHCDIARPHRVIDIYDIMMIAGSYGEEYNP